MRTHVDLFSGIGGFALASQWARVQTIAFAEIDPYASRVLQRHWPNIRNYGDVRDIPAMQSVWLVSGGVPCQPASVAGKRRGAADDRWLWPEALAVVDRIRPAWVLFENPTGILSLNDGLEFERICLALEGQGYEVQPLIIPACAVGAPHRRDRVWIIAHCNNLRFSHGTCSESGNLRRQDQEASQTVENGADSEFGVVSHGISGNVAYSEPNGRDTQAIPRESLCPRSQTESRKPKFRRTSDAADNSSCDEGINRYGQWVIEPDVGRVADGIPASMDRLRCLGNAIVPQVAYQLIKRMIGAEESEANHGR